jgi:septal ring factor EnvC (AmiA/AmiB activator)
MSNSNDYQRAAFAAHQRLVNQVAADLTDQEKKTDALHKRIDELEETIQKIRTAFADVLAKIHALEGKQ